MDEEKGRDLFVEMFDGVDGVIRVWVGTFLASG